MDKKKDGLLKRPGFRLHIPCYGLFEAKDHEPEYRDKSGKKVPKEKTKWVSKSKK
jgi:hypothetical protein